MDRPGRSLKTGREYGGAGEVGVAGHGEAKPMRAAASGPLGGRVEVPGDKSVSHRR